MQLKFKQALITWIAIYPLITIILWLFGDQLAQLPVPLRTLILTVILVPLMVFWAVPRLRQWLHW